MINKTDRTAGRKKRRGLTIRQKNAIAGYLFFSPWIIGFFLFTAYSVAYALKLSFNSVDRINGANIEMTFKGLDYYYSALRVDTVFPQALTDSAIFILCSTPVIVVFSIVIALLLNHVFPGRTFFRAVFFLPVIIISGPVLTELLSGDGAMVIQPSQNAVYQFVAQLPETLSKPVLYTLDNLVQILWFSGVQTIIFLAGLQKVDHSVFEAASIDGASGWVIFWKISLPVIRPLILVNSLYTIVEISNFPNNMVNYKIVDHMFETARPFSYSAAMSWLYFLEVLLIIGLAFLILNNWKERRYERWLKRQ